MFVKSVFLSIIFSIFSCVSCICSTERSKLSFYSSNDFSKTNQPSKDNNPKRDSNLAPYDLKGAVKTCDDMVFDTKGYRIDPLPEENDPEYEKQVDGDTVTFIRDYCRITDEDLEEMYNEEGIYEGPMGYVPGACSILFVVYKNGIKIKQGEGLLISLVNEEITYDYYAHYNDKNKLIYTLRKEFDYISVEHSFDYMYEGKRLKINISQDIRYLSDIEPIKETYPDSERPLEYRHQKIRFTPEPLRNINFAFLLRYENLPPREIFNKIKQNVRYKIESVFIPTKIDEVGNWIEGVKYFSDSNQEEIMTRKITYYKALENSL